MITSDCLPWILHLQQKARSNVEQREAKAFKRCDGGDFDHDGRGGKDENDQLQCWYLRPESCNESVANVFEQDEVDKRIHSRVQHLSVAHYDDMTFV